MRLSQKEHKALMEKIRDKVNALIKQHGVKQRTCWYGALPDRENSVLQFAWLIGKKKRLGFPSWDSGFRLIHSFMDHEFSAEKRFCFMYVFARNKPDLSMGLTYELGDPADVDLAAMHVFNWIQNGMWPTADGCHEEPVKETPEET